MDSVQEGSPKTPISDPLERPNLIFRGSGRVAKKRLILQAPPGAGNRAVSDGGTLRTRMPCLPEPGYIKIYYQHA